MQFFADHFVLYFFANIYINFVPFVAVNSIYKCIDCLVFYCNAGFCRVFPSGIADVTNFVLELLCITIAYFAIVFIVKFCFCKRLRPLFLVVALFVLYHMRFC